MTLIAQTSCESMVQTPVYKRNCTTNVSDCTRRIASPIEVCLAASMAQTPVDKCTFTAHVCDCTRRIANPIELCLAA